MKMTFLGSGSAFTLDNWQSNILIEANNQKLLLDCGGDIRWSLKDQNKTLCDIDAVYVSHCHNDHIGGLEALAFMTYFNPNKNKPTLFIHESFVDELWSKSLSGGLESLEDEKATLRTYFDVRPVSDDCSFIWNDIKFNLIKVIHILNDHNIVPSYGLYFDVGTKILFTSDTQYCPTILNSMYEKCDIIFHDCETTSFCKSGVHSHYSDLCYLNNEIKAKIWLYHWNGPEGNLPDAVKDGFAGFVKKGQSWNF